MDISKIKPEEISLLTSLLFLPKDQIIYDPRNRIVEDRPEVVRDITALLKSASTHSVCINLSNQKLEVQSFDFILEFGRLEKGYKSFSGQQFLSINNPDGSIRWFLPESSQNPNFLALYNGTGLKANTGLQLSNICPSLTIPHTSIQPLHLKALKNLYAETFQTKLLSSLEAYKTVEANFSKVKALKNTTDSISNRKVERLSYNLKVLFHCFDPNALVPVAYAHGDFTPWNMFVGQEQIHLYDWELAVPEQVFLFDAFHFIFQSSVLNLHESFDVIKEKIEDLEYTPEIKDLVERYRLDFWECYRWYLIYNCSYYLPLYMKQEKLHEQAFWLIDCWIEASYDAIRCPKQKAEMAF